MFHPKPFARTPGRRARRSGVWLLPSALLVSALLAASGCSATVTSNTVALAITQHADSLALSPGQTAAKTVLCDAKAGEALIGGGRAAAGVNL